MHGAMIKQTRKKPRVGDGTPGPGRPKGSVNRYSAALKDMILVALSEAGGVDYLRKQAVENPVAFLSLVGRVLPMTVQGAGDTGQHKIEVTWLG